MKCKQCDNLFKPESRRRKFCSRRCSAIWQQETYWESVTNKIEQNELVPARALKKYLKEKFGEKCQLCGWNKINKFTNKVPVELEHVDGNSENSILSNVRLICPNCHSLTSTYKALNVGNGRHSRRERYKAGKSF